MGFAEFPCVMPTIHPNILWTAKTTKVYKPTSCKILGGFSYGKLLGPFCSNCFNLQTRKPGANTRCHRAMVITSVQWLCRAAPFWSVFMATSALAFSHLMSESPALGWLGVLEDEHSFQWQGISVSSCWCLSEYIPCITHITAFLFPLTLTICTNSLIWNCL